MLAVAAIFSTGEIFAGGGACLVTWGVGALSFMLRILDAGWEGLKIFGSGRL